MNNPLLELVGSLVVPHLVFRSVLFANHFYLEVAGFLPGALPEHLFPRRDCEQLQG